MNLSLDQVKSTITRWGLQTGRLGYFEKGHVPANKGKKQKVTGRMAENWFKKGHIPIQHKEIGSERHQRDKRGVEYIHVKVAEPNKWKMKQVIEWEKYNGSIPKNHIVIFLNGDTTDCNIENLALIDRATHLIMNKRGLRTADAELTKIGVSTAKLIKKLTEVKKDE